MRAGIFPNSGGIFQIFPLCLCESCLRRPTFHEHETLRRQQSPSIWSQSVGRSLGMHLKLSRSTILVKLECHLHNPPSPVHDRVYNKKQQKHPSSLMKELANLIFIGIGFISIRIHFFPVGITFGIGFPAYEVTPCNPK